MSDPRPASTDGADDAARLLRAAARRQAVAATDLSLPDRLRLSEQQRSTVRGLIGKCVRAVEDELRAALAPGFARAEALHAALSSAQVEIAGPLLESSPALDDPALIAILLRRAEEHRLFVAGGAGGAFLVDLVGEEEGGLAAPAMAVLVAQSRRLDRFGDPALARTELPAEIQHRLVWTVAAALRLYMIERHGVAPAEADDALSAAAAQAIGGYDEGDSLEARAQRLVRGLEAAGRLDGATVARTLIEGNLTLFVAALALRSGLDTASVSELLLGQGDGAALLLRLAGLGRDDAAAVLLRLGADAERRLAHFDGLSADRAREALLPWRSDAAYRRAIVLVEARA